MVVYNEEDRLYIKDTDLAESVHVLNADPVNVVNEDDEDDLRCELQNALAVGVEKDPECIAEAIRRLHLENATVRRVCYFYGDYDTPENKGYVVFGPDYDVD